jgi:hypothetical protein
MEQILADYFYPLMGTGVIIAIGLLLYILRGNPSNSEASSGTVEDSGHASNAPAEDVFSHTPSGIEAEVSMLIDYGNKVEAIRVVREKLGLDHKSAADLVSAMEHGAPFPPIQPATANADSAPNMSSLLQTS